MLKALPPPRAQSNGTTTSLFGNGPSVCRYVRRSTFTYVARSLTVLDLTLSCLFNPDRVRNSQVTGKANAAANEISVSNDGDYVKPLPILA